jgi:Domain of unknown function (DUF4402)
VTGKERSMRKLLAIAVAVTALGLGGQANAAGNTANAGATSSTTVITPITITKTADLRFGQFVQPTVGGQIDINASGTVDLTGITPAGLTSIVQLGSGRGAGSFNITGQALRVYLVLLPSTAILTRIGGAETMTVSAVRRTGGIANRTLSATGTDTLGLGGTLVVDAFQAIGAYSGSIIMTVTYQ